jgi:predicted RNase H-like HicB family nuclease
MAAATRRSLNEYLALQYPFNVIADREIGGYVVTYPDLPGCTTHVECIEDVGATAEEIRRLWIRTEYEDEEDIPLPSYPSEYSGKFIVRTPRSLHRQLVVSAEQEGVSLNQYVLTLLAQRDAQARVEAKLDALLAAQSRQEQPARIAS